MTLEKKRRLNPMTLEKKRRLNPMTLEKKRAQARQWLAWRKSLAHPIPETFH
jgi:hypothetical protein